MYSIPWNKYPYALCPIESRFELLIFETAGEQKDRRNREQSERDRKLQGIEGGGCCEGYFHECRNIENIEWVPAMTRYNWDIDKEPLEDPNRDLFLCPTCSKWYSEHWQERWDDYYGGLL